MAHLAQLGALADDLVAAIAGIPETQRGRHNASRDFVVRTLRTHTFTRTNHFDVEARLRGLEEHFSVVGRDGLAQALRDRLDALAPHRNQTSPEILHLLLELADQPAQKSKLSDLDALVEPEEDAPPPLTWRDIAREDGWKNERDIWRFVDYAPGSSDEEEADIASEVSLETLTTASSAEDSCQRTAADLAIQPQGDDLLKQIEQAQSWRYASSVDVDGQPTKVPISTLQFLREALFMIAGLETSLFDQHCTPIAKYQLQGVSWDAHKALATLFAECGRKLAPLRAFSKAKEESPLLQVFQNCLQKALRSLDLLLSSIQGRFVAIKEDVVVSLIGVLEELGPTLSPLYDLAAIVRRLQEERNPHAFRYLELLDDAVGMAQLQGSQATFKLLGTIFFDCFQVYLKPIRLWMEEGKLVPGDRTFFVSESQTKLPLQQIWKGQFNLRRTPEGNLHAPRFLNPAIQRIFTAGQSIVVLQHMKRHESTKKYRASTEPKMDLETVCPPGLELAPFSELFGAAFQAWIQSKHHTAAATLRELLFSSYGLSESLDALEHIYLMSDGARADAFASSVFRHLDTLSSSWRDRFTLTEIAQEAFSACVDSYRLSAEVDPRAVTYHGTAAADARASVRHSLPAIRLKYRLSWPVQIIVPDEAIRSYQTIFTFQLQARRALSVLHRRPVPSPPHSTTPAMARYYHLRTRLLWFCTTLTTYLTTLVLAPNTSLLRAALRDSAGVDDMVAAHGAFVARVTAEALQGQRLRPILEAVLDVFDLAVRLADAQAVEMARAREEEMEVSRLSVMSSPFKASTGRRGGGARRRVREEEEEEDGDGDGEEGGWMAGRGDGEGRPHGVVMRELLGDFERHLRFVVEGLRGVARASREEAAAKWDLLAEMLEVGIKE
ncbi:Spc98 family-domain-containing protein [Staphylotrichum tortipilum]|uniref:Spindle pole body component n=1 Tax=Staphylotrichum tortipilum TaxID=2831512 RepID=A0AAN6RVS3_9PEZI|nr:Spc98 family-domain-containing protein [Staphylotrichum longicolle]